MSIDVIMTVAVIALLALLWCRAEFKRSEAERLARAECNAKNSQAIAIKGLSRQLNEYQDRELRWRWEHGESKDVIQAHLDGLKENYKTQKERMKHLQRKNNELTDELFGRSTLNQVRFDAFVPEKGWTKTTFKLGRGPCGLTVRALKWDELEDRYVLTQQCTNGETKRFEYMKEDVRGRREFREGHTEF